MTASPSIANGSTRPRAVQFADWRITQPAEEQSSPQPAEPPTELSVDLVAAAEAAAIRARTDAEVEKARILAEAEAEAIRIKAAEEARKLALANNRNERKEAEEQAASAARVADHNRRREETERARAAAAVQAEIDDQIEAQKAAIVEKADKKWRGWAIAFYALCAGVALPVQCSAFWDRDKPWMVGAPVLLEIAALVVAFGTAAAVANKRPHWHFRLITWVLAFIAASVNLWHGLEEFDPATAIATALASVFGPGVWDLHEHGRIRRRDGGPTRRERKAAKKEAERIAAEQAEKELREAERQAHVEKAEREAAETLDRIRAEEFPDVHRRAWRLAADLGERAMSDAIWHQAKIDVEGAPPGESADVIRMRNAAEMRVAAAREKRPVNGSSQQVASQVLGAKQKRVYNPPARPGKRTKGDTPKQSNGARRQASIAAKNARQKDAS